MRFMSLGLIKTSNCNITNELLPRLQMSDGLQILLHFFKSPFMLGGNISEGLLYIYVHVKYSHVCLYQLHLESHHTHT